MSLTPTNIDVMAVLERCEESARAIEKHMPGHVGAGLFVADVVASRYALSHFIAMVDIVVSYYGTPGLEAAVVEDNRDILSKALKVIRGAP